MMVTEGLSVVMIAGAVVATAEAADPVAQGEAAVAAEAPGINQINKNYSNKKLI